MESTEFMPAKRYDQERDATEQRIADVTNMYSINNKAENIYLSRPLMKKKAQLTLTISGLIYPIRHNQWLLRDTLYDTTSGLLEKTISNNLYPLQSILSV